MLFKHAGFYMKIYINDWSWYNILENEKKYSELLLDNNYAKGLNKNSIIALYSTSVNHAKQKKEETF